MIRESLIAYENDVADYEKWKIEGKYVTSFNLQFLDLKQMGEKVQEVIPSDLPIVTVCEQGHLAVKAADVLASQGYEVTVLKGGMEAWS